jgi:predicted dehydrogenase
VKEDRAGGRSGLTRRQFIGAAASAAAFTIVPRHVLGGAGNAAPSETLNIAAIGVGGHGAFLIDEIATHSKGMPHGSGSVKFVALCDVDEKRASETIVRRVPSTTNYGGFKKFPKAEKYNDYRRMLDKEEKSIDAVVVSTPDPCTYPPA